MDRLLCDVNWSDYTKSEFCMKEFCVAQSKRKLLVVACELLSTIGQVDPRQFPAASGAISGPFRAFFGLTLDRF